LHRVLAAKLSVSPAMALRLGKFCGNDAAVWLNMQRAYDLWHAEQELSKDLSRIKTRKVAA
jgi:addiction module HigA family antidote